MRETKTVIEKFDTDGNIIYRETITETEKDEPASPANPYLPWPDQFRIAYA